MKFPGLALAPVCLALMACGGDGADSGIAVPNFGGVGSGPLSSAELFAAAQSGLDLANAVTNGELNAATPGTAFADYNGTVIATADVNPEGSQAFAGNISASANFIAGTLTGSAGDFASYDTVANGRAFIEPLSGTLPITNGTIADTIVSADLNGTLSSSTDSFAVNTSLLGFFADNSGTNVLIASGSGTSTSIGTGVVDNFNAAVIAAEQ